MEILESNYIFKNSIIVILGIIISNLFAYIFHIFVGRYLGPSLYGEFGALVSILVIISVPSYAITLSLTKFSSNYVNIKDYNKVAILKRNIFRLLLIIGFVIFLVSFFMSKNIADYLKINSRIPIILTTLVMVCSLFLPINRGLLQTLRKFKIYSYNLVFESIVRFLIVILFLLLGLGVNGAILSYGLAYLLSYFIILPYIKEIKIEKNEKIEMKEIYKFIFIVFFAGIFIQSMINLPTFFIKHYFSSEFAGYWSAALNIARISLFVSTGISFVIFPEVASNSSNSNKNKNKLLNKLLLKKALILCFLISLLIALSFLFFGKLIIYFLYGPRFLEASNILNWLGFLMIPIGMIQLIVNYKLARR